MSTSYVDMFLKQKEFSLFSSCSSLICRSVFNLIGIVLRIVFLLSVSVCSSVFAVYSFLFGPPFAYFQKG